MRVNVVLIGPPGSGKGTQAVRLARRYAIPHISTGDMLRQAVRDGSELGHRVGALIAQGSLVSDELITNLVRERLRRPDTSAGFILDGYPRTPHQAEALDGIVNDAPLVIALIDVVHEEIVRRIVSRRICESCGITQSVSAEDAQSDASCPYCGGRLVRRADDDPDTVRRRLATYAALADPVIAYYRERPVFFGVNGLRPPDEVTSSLVAGINARVKV